MFETIFNIALIIFIVLTLACLNSYSLDDYIVRSIYFIPTDSIDRSDWLDLGGIMKGVQLTYKDQMDRHGFPNQTFRLETDQDGKVIVHKVKGDHNKAHYAGNTASILIKELERKHYDDIHTVYSIVMAGMQTVQNGSGGVAEARPWGGWFGNGNSQYSGYSISPESDRGRAHIKRVIQHELGHTFGLWHVALYDPGGYMMSIFGDGNKLAFHEARWLSKIHYFNFNRVWHHNFAPDVTDFHGAEAFEHDKIRFRSTISDRDGDGIFQTYAWVDFDIVGWNLFDEKDATILADIKDIDRKHLIHSNSITFQSVDEHGNWTINFPQSYVLPKVVNKNEDLNVEQDDEVDDNHVDHTHTDHTPRPVNHKLKLTTYWASIKAR